MAGPLHREFCALKTFFFGPISPRPLGALRIGISLCLLWQAYALGPELFDFYGEHGLVQEAVNHEMVHPWAPQLRWLFAPWHSLGLGSYDQLVLVVFAIYGAALLALLLGWHTRAASILTWFLHFMFMNSNFGSLYGVDQFFHIVLFYFTWMPIAQWGSMDLWQHRVSLEPRAGASIGLRLLQFHLCLVYLCAGIGKAMGPSWWNGESIWRALLLPENRLYDFSWMAAYPWVPQLLGLSTIALECFYPLLIWPSATRRWWIAGVVGLHLGIGLFQGLYLFAAVMIVLTTCCFGLESKMEVKRLSQRSTK